MTGSIPLRTSCLIALLVLFGVNNAQCASFAGRPEVSGFIDAMVAQHGFDRKHLQAIFRQIKSRETVIRAITRPAEDKPWHEYRPIFIKPARIRDGAAFWSRHADLLARAQARYGVPPQIVTAIIGVETRYGKHVGRYRVVESLATLAFDYPPRGAFFRSELEQYLLLTRQESIDPLSMKGSYAGAIGQAQFIPSSYRRYAVDFDDDGQRDLLHSTADAIGSVANYLHEHGWQTKGTIASRARVTGTDYKDILAKGLRPTIRVGQLAALGIQVVDKLPQEHLVTLVKLDARSGPEYWVGSQNFYVITRYNHSALYAMAVYQLSEEIRAVYMTARTHSAVARQ